MFSSFPRTTASASDLEKPFIPLNMNLPIVSFIDSKSFLIWFLMNIVTIFNGSYDEVVNFFTSQPSKILFSIFIVSMFFYSALSISEIFEDYIKQENLKKYANLGVFLSSLIIPLFTIITIIYL